MTEQEIAGEINGYKQQLEQSDYKVMKAVERIFSASSIRHFRQAAATRKSSISNARHTFRNRYFRQAVAKCKSKYPNLRYRLATQL